MVALGGSSASGARANFPGRGIACDPDAIEARVDALVAQGDYLDAAAVLLFGAASLRDAARESRRHRAAFLDLAARWQQRGDEYRRLGIE